MLNVAKLWSSVVGQPETPSSAPVVVPPTLSRGPRVTPQFPEPMERSAESKVSQTREATRFVPRRTATVLTTSAGKKIGARIINLSQLGVAVEADFSQAGSDTVVMVGSRPVRPGRRIALGTVFLFVKPIDPAVCDPDIVV